MDSWQGSDELIGGTNFDTSDNTGDGTHSEPCCDWYVAEDVPEYGSSTNSNNSGKSPSSDLIGRGGSDMKLLRVAMALVEGTQLAATDRTANIRRLRTAVQRATGVDAAAGVDVGAEEFIGAVGVTDPESLPRDAIAARLKALARSADRDLAEQIRLLVTFEDAELYKADGCSSMCIWVDWYLKLARTVCYERLRVGRALTDLPILESLFTLGKLSFSQLQEITRHATAATDAEFAIATLDLSVSETIEYCRRFRHVSDKDEDAANAKLEGQDAAEAKAAIRAFSRRSLTSRQIDAHSLRVTIDLPNDLGAEWLASLEQNEDWIRGGGEDASSAELAGEAELADKDTLTDEKPTAAQLRADAAVLMSRQALAHAGEAVAKADRYRVHANMDVRLLAEGPIVVDGSEPIERPFIQGHGPIAREQARRLAAESGFTLIATDHEGEPVGTMQVAPAFTKQQLKQLRARDRRCVMPGCGAIRHLQGHHVEHREHGGRSDLTNGCCVCASCHRLLHEGGFTLDRIADDEIDLGHAATGIVTDERSRAQAEAKVARIRRFRLLDADGQEVAGVGAAWRSVESKPGSSDA